MSFWQILSLPLPLCPSLSLRVRPKLLSRKRWNEQRSCRRSLRALFTQTLPLFMLPGQVSWRSQVQTSEPTVTLSFACSCVLCNVISTAVLPAGVHHIPRSPQTHLSHPLPSPGTHRQELWSQRSSTSPEHCQPPSRGQGQASQQEEEPEQTWEAGDPIWT